MTSKKIAVVLFNLGGPDSKQAIEPFLMNFFTDKNIITAPFPVRWCIAKMISKKRSKKEAGDSYAELGDKSPLLENSLKQAKALKKVLNSDKNVGYETFVSMNYWHPMADEIVKKVKYYNPDQIILLPLYPQFSTTTTKSSFEGWNEACKKHGLAVPTSGICCYPWQDGFIKASADNVLKVYKQACNKYKNNNPPRVLFSAHGLPEKIIKAGDPYQWQCQQGAQKIADMMGVPDLDWDICYQSRVGRLKWIGPSTEEALQKAADEQVPVVIYPHAFTQEHVETLVEIDIEYREEAEKMGVVGFEKVDTVGVSKPFIEGLKALVHQSINQNGVLPDGGEALCPKDFAKCCQTSKIMAG